MGHYIEHTPPYESGNCLKAFLRKYELRKGVIDLNKPYEVPLS